MKEINGIINFRANENCKIVRRGKAFKRPIFQLNEIFGYENKNGSVKSNKSLSPFKFKRGETAKRHNPTPIMQVWGYTWHRENKSFFSENTIKVFSPFWGVENPHPKFGGVASGGKWEKIIIFRRWGDMEWSSTNGFKLASSRIMGFIEY